MSELHLRILESNQKAETVAILHAASVVSQRKLTRTVQWFEWKYWGSPFGKAIIAYAQTNDGEVAGVVAFGQYELTHGLSNLKAALSYQTFVHPNYRRVGLFTNLSQMATDVCNQQGTQLMFNFPNTQSLAGFKKQGWIEVDCVRSFVKPLHWGRVISQYNMGLRSARFNPDVVTEFSPRDYKGFEKNLLSLSSVRADNIWAPHRTPEYLLWRYYTYPLNRYLTVTDDNGWAILRTGKRGRYIEAQVMELFPVKGEEVKLLRSLSQQIRKKLDSDIISLTISTDHPVFNSVRRSGFFPIPNSINFTYKPLETWLTAEKRSWILTATEFHTY